MSTSKKESLFFLFWKVKFFQLKEQLKVLFCYYTRSFPFFLVDLSLHFAYFFKNPYRISRKFLIKRGAEKIDLYGETPLTAIEKVFSYLNIGKDDHFLELGAGRGRIGFWVKAFKGCKVTLVEYNPRFVKTMRAMIQRFSFFQDIEILQKDLFQIDLPKATCCYIYGSCFTDKEIEKLLRQLLALPAQCYVITISYSLLEYGALQFALIKKIPIKFAWGKTLCYVQQKVG